MEYKKYCKYCNHSIDNSYCAVCKKFLKVSEFYFDETDEEYESIYDQDQYGVDSDD